MRPRKTILLVNANEAQLGMQRFMLETRGYRVLVAEDADAALALHALGVDLVLGFADGMLAEWAALAKRMKGVEAEVPILLSMHVKNSDARFAVAPQADAVMLQASTAELLEWVKLRIARRRGPRRIALVPVLALARV